MPTIQENITSILTQIRQTELKYSRKPNSVSLLAVSKGQSLEKIKEAYASGHMAFGENYLQEALLKIAELPDAEWHFIGHIQRNKTKKIAEHFNWVHSVCDETIAKRLSDQRPSSLPPLNVCIEVNISSESSKLGVDISKLTEIAAFSQALPNIKLRGLMAIPAPKKTLDEQRAQFQLLRELFDNLNKKNLNLDTLSMGMSEDFEAAIAEGATIVRIGTAIFGPRIQRVDS